METDLGEVQVQQTCCLSGKERKTRKRTGGLPFGQAIITDLKQMIMIDPFPS